VPFSDRVLLGLTLADLCVLSDEPAQARDVLDIELTYAEHVSALIQQSGSDEQLRAAASGCDQLRDKAAQVGLVTNPAPEIEVVDWVTGEPTTLAARRGRVVVIDFWARWCRACVAMFPSLVELQERYRERGLTVLALTRYGSAENGPQDARLREAEVIRGIANQHCAKIAVGIAPDDRLWAQYGANRMPAVTVVDRAGVVQFASSISDKSKLENVVAKLIEDPQ
jgi:thiol-disulfide isomerase/thioredoxin